jgi:nicotinamidase-related amidase
MPVTTLDPNSALVVVDLQQGIASYPLLKPLPEVVAQANRLADAFRRRGLPVVLVVVADGPRGRVEQGRPPGQLPPEFYALVPDLSRAPNDHHVTKLTRGAFSGTDLDEYLRGQGVTQIVLAGVATSNGVDWTARSAFDLGYNVTFALDAMTDVDPENEEHSVRKIFPRIGETGSTDDILAVLDRGTD